MSDKKLESSVDDEGYILYKQAISLHQVGVTEVLNIHLNAEFYLNRFLEHAFVFPSVIKLDKIYFASKLDLCRALGILDQTAYNGLKSLNFLRRKIAHERHYVITNDDIEKLRVGFSRKSLNDNIRKKDTLISKLSSCLMYAMVCLEYADRSQKQVMKNLSN